MTPSLTIIITTYNRPDALAAVLSGLLHQSDNDFSIMIADDGSKNNTRELVSRYKEKFAERLNSVWQEDLGFRAAAIRNKAVAQTQNDYLVFIDGDCVPQKDFVKQHKQLAEKGYWVGGRRILLSKDFTQEVLEKNIPIHSWMFWHWLLARIKKQCNRVFSMLSLPLGFVRKLSKTRWQAGRTCNLGVWRQDFMNINGFDESYEGWGFEDSDLVIRLIRNGIFHKSGRFAIPIIHLWHAENDRSHLPENKARLQKILNSQNIRAEKGINEYL